MSLRVRLLGAVSYVLLLAIVAFGVPLALNLSARVHAEVRTQAQAQADLVAATAGDLLVPPQRRELAVLAKSASTSLGGRVIIVDARGRVLSDSAGPAEVGSSYLSRPEIATALHGRPIQIERNSQTLGQPLLATGVPIIHDSRTVGAVRVTQSVRAVGSAVRRAELMLVGIGLVVLALGLVAGGVMAAQIERPLRRLEATARRIAHGDLTARAAVEGSTEQRSLAGSFNEMTERIGRLLAAQREFVADASHQLRTPLTGLRLRLEAARGGAGAQTAEDDLGAALEEVDRLSRIVDELLSLSRAGEPPRQGGDVELGSLAVSALERWQGEAAALGLELTRAREGAGGVATAAPADLERALDALVENALRYSRAGSAVTIVERPGRIEVRDRGPGLGDDERERVFERFHRGRAGRQGPRGFGLGLPIARELVRRWGGDVRLEPRAGGGTTAILEVPCHAVPARGREGDFASA